MYGLRGTTSKTLVWLAALLMPMQPVSAAGCCCATPDQQDDDRADSQVSARAASSCCQVAHCCCAGKQAARTSCCQKRHGAVDHSWCQCGHACCCQHGEPSPAPPQAPPSSKVRTGDELGQPLAAVSCNHGEVHLGPSPQPTEEPSLGSAAKRCVMLCRFLL